MSIHPVLIYFIISTFRWQEGPWVWHWDHSCHGWKQLHHHLRWQRIRHEHRTWTGQRVQPAQWNTSKGMIKPFQWNTGKGTIKPAKRNPSQDKINPAIWNCFGVLKNCVSKFHLRHASWVWRESWLYSHNDLGPIFSEMSSGNVLLYTSIKLFYFIQFLRFSYR